MNFLRPDDTLPSEQEVPSWLVAADNHSIGNTKGGSWFNPATWDFKFENSGKFISTAMLSGLNSFYNTGVNIGNWFGKEYEYRDTGKWISGLDSDLGKYYEQNREAADLAGFVATALVPGLSGIKVLNAGQAALRAAEAGHVGRNMSFATRLLAPSSEMYVQAAAKEFAATNATFSLINNNVFKALASGFQQNFLEAAAFEAAVYATMHKSPILENQELSDAFKNIAIGGTLGGVIGGAFSIARTRYALKNIVQAEDKAAKFATAVDVPLDSLPPYARAILRRYDMDMSAVPVQTGDDAAIFIKDKNNYIAKAERINNGIREDIRAMAKGDEIGNLVADTLQNNPKALAEGQTGFTHIEFIQNLMYADEIARVRAPMETQKLMAKVMSELDMVAASKLAVRYIKTYGDDAGKVSPDAPIVTSIADAVLPKKGMTTRDAVLGAAKQMGFKTDKLWDPLSLTKITANHEAELRAVWLRGKQIKEGTQVHQNDIPMLEHLFETDQFRGIKFVGDKGAIREINSSNEMYDFIREAKTRVIDGLLGNMLKKQIPEAGGTELLARIANVSRNWIEGIRNLDNEYRDLFYRQHLTKELAEQRFEKGLTSSVNLEDARVEFIPEYFKVGYRIPDEAPILGTDGFIADAVTFIKTQEKKFIGDVDRVVARYAPEVAQILPEITDDMLWSTTRYGAGPGLISFAASAYGSVEEAFTLLGRATSRLKVLRKEAAKEILNSPLVRLAQTPKAAIEFDALSRKIASTSEHYAYVDDMAEFGGDTGPGLVATKFLKEGIDPTTVKLQQGADAYIPLEDETLREAVRAHIDVTDRRLILEKDLAAARGKENHKTMGVFQPVRPNPKDYPYVAFVYDPRVTGAGHVRMIHANTEEKLNSLVARVRQEFPEYTVRTKVDAEEFYKAQGEYEFSRTLHENYIDSDLSKRGINSEFFIKTDPQKIVDDILNYHMRQEDVVATELIRAKYTKQFHFLEDQLKQYSNIEASKYGTSLERVEKFEKNPYSSYMKLGLDITKVSEYPLLFDANRSLDRAISNAYGRVVDMFSKAKSADELEKINGYLKEVGYNTGYSDAALDLLVNHTAPRGALTKFVRTANAVLARFVLGLDPLNALNNAIGANVLRGTELNQITKGIKNNRPDLVGKLADISKIALPGESKALATSPAKLMGKAIQNYFEDMRTPGNPLASRYKRDGLIQNLTEQFRSIVDDFTLQGTESVADLNKRMNRAIEKARELADVGEKYTGNTFAEEFNRFISADVMRQLTDVAIEAGAMTPREAKAYINNFVNRVEGNIIASQRPLLFQGPIGQAVGLFQSYQFNLLQNLFRYVGEGTKKDTAMLLGLQGTFYGLNGMPGFHFINQHIVGTASGNTEHKDLYYTTYGIAGLTAGDFLLYGMPSFVMQTNLYTRGDINPRQPTIIPASLEQIPFVGAYGRFFDSILSIPSNIKMGTPVYEAFLEGIEHNGLSRPLAGVAQTARALTSVDGQVYSTSTRGTMMGSNDLLSWSTAVRIAGGRPLDEAILNDAFFRMRAYEAVDRGKKLALSTAVKIGAASGQVPSDEQVAIFAERYALSGGKQSQFNRWMMEQYKNATTPESEEIARQLANPLSVKAQQLMGGDEYEMN